jgi:hypothetical protein
MVGTISTQGMQRVHVATNITSTSSSIIIRVEVWGMAPAPTSTKQT